MDFTYCGRHHTVSDRKIVEANSGAMDAMPRQEHAIRSVRGLRHGICMLLGTLCKNEAAKEEDDNVGGTDE